MREDQDEMRYFGGKKIDIYRLILRSTVKTLTSDDPKERGVDICCPTCRQCQVDLTIGCFELGKQIVSKPESNLIELIEVRIQLFSRLAGQSSSY